MIFFHGTNVEELTNGSLVEGSWLTSDPYTAADFAVQRGGANLVYVLWCQEQEVEFVYFPSEVIPAWRLRLSKKPIGRLLYDESRNQLHTNIFKKYK